jgi:hypothetical protein
MRWISRFHPPASIGSGIVVGRAIRDRSLHSQSLKSFAIPSAGAPGYGCLVNSVQDATCTAGDSIM